jgi:beta-lactamase regulating signal transducer with metallopeptidase domain
MKGEVMLNAVIEGINKVGAGWWMFSTAMLVQASILIAIIFLLDLFLRKRIRAVVRYWIWMLVLVKLALPTSLSLPTGVGYWVENPLANTLTTENTGSAEINKVINHELTPINTNETTIENPKLVLASERGSKIQKFPAAPRATSSELQVTVLTWQGFAFLGWLAGMAALAIIVIQRMLFVRALIAQSQPADGRLAEAMAECCRKMGIRSNVELRLTKNMLSPAACGLLRPIILMPESLLENLSSQKLRAVLTHELVHIKRGDLGCNLFQTILQVAYFYNPLVWIANAMIRQVREQAVDEATLVNLGDEAKDYGTTLVDIAEMALSRPHFSLRLVGVVESKKSLAGRIKHIMSRPMPKSAKIGVVGFAAVAVIGMVLLPMAKAERKSTTATQDHGHIMRRFAVIHENLAKEIIMHSRTYKSVPNGYFLDSDILKTILQDANKFKIVYRSDKMLAGSMDLRSEAWTDSKNLNNSEYTQVSVSSNGRYRLTFEGQHAELLLDSIVVNSHLNPGPNVMTTISWKGIISYGQVLAFLIPYVNTKADTLYLLVAYDIVTEMPMNTADKESNNFNKTLPNGVTVELVGVCEYPSKGKQWWKPDGLPLGSRIETHDPSNYADKNNGYEIAYTFETPDGAHVGQPTIKGSTAQSGLEVKSPSGTQAVRSHINVWGKTTTVKFPVAAGMWTTIGQTTGKGQTNKKFGSQKLMFGPAEGTREKLVLTTSDDLKRDDEYRLVAYDKQGTIYTSVKNWFSIDNLRQSTFVFANLDPAVVDRYEFQTRPYEWVEFKNVSLRPNSQSKIENPKSEIESPNQQAVEANSVGKGQKSTLIAPYIEQIKRLQGHKQAAFAFGPQLTMLDPNVGFAIIQKAWLDIKDDDVKTGLMKAFVFADHPKAIDIVVMAIEDNSPAVRSYAFAYVPRYAGKDFDGSVAEFRAWYEQVKGMPVQQIRDLSVQMNRPQVKAKVEKIVDDFQSGKPLTELRGSLAQLYGGLDPIVIPYFIGLIDADNSYDSIYDIGYFGLGEITGVQYSEFHDGAWWRRWWEANKSKYPPNVQQVAIPDLKKTEAGKKHVPYPPSLDTLDGKLEWIVKEAKAGNTKQLKLSGIAGEIAKHSEAKAIPVLIGIIETDNTYDTIYGVGYFGLSPLTGVKYDSSHDGKWWRQWWETNKSQYSAAEVRQLPKVDGVQQPAEANSVGAGQN